MDATLISVQPSENYQLVLEYSDGKTKLFNMKPFMETGIFRELKDTNLFNTVHVIFDTVQWDNGADFDPDVLYENSKEISSIKQ